MAIANRPTASELFERRLQERKAEFGARFQLAVIRTAKGEEIGLDEIAEICDGMGFGVDRFDDAVSNQEQRFNAEADYSHLASATAALAELDGEESKEIARHEEIMNGLNSRRELPALLLKAANRAETILKRTRPQILNEAIRKVWRERSPLNQLLETTVGLTNSERELLTRSVAYDENNRRIYGGFKPWSGVNPAAAAAALRAVDERERQLKERKGLARAKIVELDATLERLQALSMKAVITPEDIEAVLKGAEASPEASADETPEEIGDDQQV